MSCLHFDSDEIRWAQTMADMAASSPERGFAGVLWVAADPGAYLGWHAWDHPDSTAEDHRVDLIDERFLEYLNTDPEDELGGRVQILRRDTGKAWEPGAWDDAVDARSER